ncbi:2-octaprenyl-6-methoxyphenol hydroxylase [Inhella inkyongensis]|uniref:2-octaprenyl-6-methoxyphenol hydroxylase n=1 Tax=Inhella inkyongensis TaxID=392593 RepID=A0A840RW25_9BURK|nr:FAD-dependent monooxygenase [Inhella inkyongensis]MBB5202877.1 2-octaprenyl-6-methoxyphenol hydroxylase [Inhella inkyongensis]
MLDHKPLDAPLPLDAPRIAVVGAGPVGLAFAVQAAQALPQAQIVLFDARPITATPPPDPRTLALNLGSIQHLSRLQAWEAVRAEAILEVSVSQSEPGRTDLRLRASELRQPLLGAVLGYADVLAPLAGAWLALEAAQLPAQTRRLRSAGGQKVAGHKMLADGRIELDAGVAEAFDLVVQAEGGLFAEQAGKPWRREYAQTAWVGQIRLGADWPRGLAVERFTRDGPLAVLPLPDDARGRRAALVWCTSPDEPAEALSLARLQALLPAAHRAATGIDGPLKAFPLGLNAETQLVQGRLVRIGNAAQTLHPVAGQGLNLGLRDAHQLVTALREGVERAADLDTALARFERRRRPDRLALLATTDGLARVFAGDSAALSLAREVGLRALQALPPLRSALARQLMFGWR